MQWLTFKKGVFCALRPRLWRHLMQGVAPTIEHIPALSRFSFRTVVDVGANRGQFASMARMLFPAADIHSNLSMSLPGRSDPFSARTAQFICTAAPSAPKPLQQRFTLRLATIHPRSCSPTKSRKMYSGCAPPAQNRFRLSGCLSVLTLQH